MDKKVVFPNHPLFFLQFIVFPFIIMLIFHQIGWTIDVLVKNLGIIGVAIIVFSYFLFVAGMVRASILVITDEHISGPGTFLDLFPVKLPKAGSEYSFESRRTGKFMCECLIIRNKYKKGQICLPNVYFTYELFDELIDLISHVDKRTK